MVFGVGKSSPKPRRRRPSISSVNFLIFLDNTNATLYTSTHFQNNILLRYWLVNSPLFVYLRIQGIESHKPVQFYSYERTGCFRRCCLQWASNAARSTNDGMLLDWKSERSNMCFFRACSSAFCRVQCCIYLTLFVRGFFVALFQGGLSTHHYIRLA